MFLRFRLAGRSPPPGDLEAATPSVVARNVSLELWIGIGVKHVVFLELWLRIASLELWLGMAYEHEEPLSCGSGWRVLLV
ncbi:hypothetical protein DEO72_LG8g2503 [Vigna unguiculata]|uniref:Uncharacterized protein n=1 Tax=Vigna unguiculata TaxID=3917 RepID=A0A4D6MX70_VIGUN|nr:hypothetical protein DEO72_LG8g2503 [Vigna unguiculata]